MAPAKSPRWEPAKAIEKGNDAVTLLGEFGTQLADRLEAGIQDGIVADVAVLGGLKTDRPVQGQKVKATTGTEREIAARGTARLSKMRGSIKHHAEKESPILEAVGVGVQVLPQQTDTVVTGLKAMVEAYGNAEYVPIFRKAGILKSDIDLCAAMRDALGAADQAQATGQGTSRGLTRAMRAAQLRIEEAVIAVSLAGQMHFLETAPKVLERFVALIPPAPPAPKKGKSGGETDAAAAKK